MTLELSAVDGLVYDDLTASTPNPGVKSGRKWKYHGQTGNTVAGNVANIGMGTVAVPALSAAATGTVTITDSKIASTSLVWLQVKIGTTTASAGAVATVHTSCRAPGSGSVVVDVTNLGSAATLSTDYQLWYWVVN